MSPESAQAIGRKSTAALAKLHRLEHERVARRAEHAENRRIARELLLEELESNRRNRARWRKVRIKPERQLVAKSRKSTERRRHVQSRRRDIVASSRSLPKYSGPIIDRNGTRGIFVRSRYWGSKTSKPGVARRGIEYIAEGAAKREDGSQYFFSNVAEKVAEAAAAFDLIEQINRAGAGNAKIAFHIIANVPHDLGHDEQMRIGVEFAEDHFGARGLPYAVALHSPSPDGDERNWHLHIIASTRPLVRTGDHEWAVGDQLRTEIDNEAAFHAMRALYADVQTDVVRSAGLPWRYTSLSNEARGLPMKPQIHLGPKLTAMARRDREIEANEINWERSIAGEAALVEEQIRHEQEAAVREATILSSPRHRLARAHASVGEPITISLAVTTATDIFMPAVTAPRLSRGPAKAGIDLGPLPAVSNLKPPADVEALLSDLTSLSKPRLSRPSRQSIVATNVPGVRFSAVDAVPVITAPRLSARTTRPDDVRPMPGAAVTLTSDTVIPSGQVLTRLAHAARTHVAAASSMSLSLSIAAVADISVETVLPNEIRVSTPARREPPADWDEVIARHERLRAQAEQRKRAADRAAAERSRRERSEAEAAAKAAAAAASLSEELASQEDQERLWHLLDLDPWVTIEDDKPATIAADAREALGADAKWLAREDVQRVLEGMANDQTEQIGGLLSDLAWRDGTLVLRRGASAMHDAVDRWGRNSAFIAFIGSVAPNLAHEPAGQVPHASEPARARPAISRQPDAGHTDIEPSKRPIPPRVSEGHDRSG